MEDFYIYLPSNVKSLYFENTSANYKTKLARPLKFKEEYEVGLAEITYTYSFLNIKEDEILELVYQNKIRNLESVGTLREYKNNVKIVPLILKKGSYTIEELINSINKTIYLNEEYDSLPHLVLEGNKTEQKVKIINGKHSKGAIFLRLSSNLCNLLGISKKDLDFKIHYGVREYIDQFLWRYEIEGFNEEEWQKQGKTNWENFVNPIEGFYLEHLAENVYDVSCGFKTIFAYSDIIKPNYVGDSLTQLLKCIEVPNNFSYGDQVHLIYDKIQYFPVCTNEFESIEIDLKDDSGENVPFTFAKNVVVLHFKKKFNKRAFEQS